MKGRKICSVVLAASLLAGTFVTPGIAADLGTEKIYSKSNPAFFNGTTSITVPLGTKVDLEETEYRIFANDFEDGDCTAKIKILSNNYKDEVGNYQIKYEVTDSHKNVSVETVEIRVEDRQDKLMERTLYTLPAISNMNTVGTQRGNNHDRQHIGLYLKAGQKIKIRQKNTEFGEKLRVTLDTDDSWTRKTFDIPKNGEWVTVEAEHDCVPSIFTPKNAKADPVIEVMYDDAVESLVYYRYQDKQDEFFNDWDESGASYAMLETNRATFLVPEKDKESILTTKENDIYGFHSIDELLEFYDGFTETFDEYMGLSYDTDELLHQNVRTKYFVKADKHGAGAAYYGGEHTAQNGDTMRGYLYRNWLPIHEFSHGYEGRLARQELALVDVLNNVLSHYVELTYKDPNSGGWMGKKQNIEKEIASVRDKLNHHNDYNQMSYRDRLYSIINLLDCIGPKEAMSYLHSLNREVTSAGIYYNTTDIFAKAFSEYSHMNVIPYLESWKLMPGTAEKANIYEQDFPIPYYLRNLVESDAKAVEIMNDLGYDGIYSLVTADDLKKYNLCGNLELTLSIDDFSQLKGKKLVIKNGEEIVKEIRIEDRYILIEDLPVGAYEIEIPNTKNVPYLYDYQYVVISNGQTTEKEISYLKEYDAIDSDIRVDMRGLGDWTFATLAYDKVNGKVNVVTNGGQPHSYYNNGRVYAEVTVSSGADTLYNRKYIGDVNNKSENEEIQVSLGDKVTIWHDEAAGRLKAFGTLTNTEETAYQAKNKTAEYVVTEYGLMPVQFSASEMYQLYLNRVKMYVEQVKERIPEDKRDHKNAYPVEKNLVRQSFGLLKEEDRNILENKYELLFRGSKPVVMVKENQFRVGDVFIPDAIFEVADKEDGAIAVTKDCLDLTNVPLKDGKFIKAGTYEVTYKVSDTDENEVTGNVALIIDEDQKEKVYTVKVNDQVAARGTYNTKVTVTAPESPEGKAFAGWKINDKTVSTDVEYTFYISEDVVLIPYYGEDEKMDVSALMTNVFVTKRADTKADVKFVGQLVVPDGYTIKNAGLVWSSKEGTELELGTGLKPTFIKKISDTNQFSVTIKGMPEGRFIRGRIFATVADENGNEKVIYSEEEIAEN